MIVNKIQLHYLNFFYNKFKPLIIYFITLVLFFISYFLLYMFGSGEDRYYFTMFLVFIIKFIIYPIIFIIQIYYIVKYIYSKYRVNFKSEYISCLYFIFYILYFIFYILYFVFYILYFISTYYNIPLTNLLLTRLPIYIIFQYIFILLFLVMVYKDIQYIKRYIFIFIAVTIDIFLQISFFIDLFEYDIFINSNYYETYFCLIPLSFALIQLGVEMYSFYKKNRPKYIRYKRLLEYKNNKK